MAIDKSYVTLGVFLGFSVFNISCCYAVNVGDSFGGGTVFCVSQTPDTTKCVTDGAGEHGLIMANEDQANYIINPRGGVTWASVTKITKAQSDDDGYDNNARIVYALPDDNSTNNAAWLSHNYRDPKEKYTDWYLPSKNELNKMYEFAKANDLIGEDCAGSKGGEILCLVGGYDKKYKAYWSSTEYSGLNLNAWSQGFSGGGQFGSDEVYCCFGVRAVRAF